MADSGRKAIEERIDEVRALVATMIRRHITPGRNEFDDLVQEAVAGILTYAHNYDPERGSLGTYVYGTAYNWLVQRVFVANRCNCRRVNQETVSLNKVVRHARMSANANQIDVELIDVIPAKENVEQEAVAKLETERLLKLMDEKLKPAEAYVIRRMLVDDDEPTLEEVAEEIGKSRERVRQLKNAGIRRLQVLTRAKKKP